MVDDSGMVFHTYLLGRSNSMHSDSPRRGTPNMSYSNPHLLPAPLGSTSIGVIEYRLLMKSGAREGSAMKSKHRSGSVFTTTSRWIFAICITSAPGGWQGGTS